MAAIAVLSFKQLQAVRMKSNLSNIQMGQNGRPVIWWRRIHSPKECSMLRGSMGHERVLVRTEVAWVKG